MIIIFSGGTMGFMDGISGWLREPAHFSDEATGMRDSFPVSSEQLSRALDEIQQAEPTQLLSDSRFSARLEKGLSGVLKGIGAVSFALSLWLPTQMLIGAGGLYAAATASTTKDASIAMEIAKSPSVWIVKLIQNSWKEVTASVSHKGVPVTKQALLADFETMVKGMDSISNPETKGPSSAYSKAQRGVMGVLKSMTALLFLPIYKPSQILCGIAGLAIVAAAMIVGKSPTTGWKVAVSPTIWLGALLKSAYHDFKIAGNGIEIKFKET